MNVIFFFPVEDTTFLCIHIKALFANLRCYDYKGVLGFCRGAVETGRQTLECLFCNWLRLLDCFSLP